MEVYLLQNKHLGTFEKTILGLTISINYYIDKQMLVRYFINHHKGLIIATVV